MYDIASISEITIMDEMSRKNSVICRQETRPATSHDQPSCVVLRSYLSTIATLLLVLTINHLPLTVSPAFAATLYVPGDYGQITNAIAHAASGDTIIVTNSSIYSEQPEIKSSTATPLIIRATGTPAATVNGMFYARGSGKTVLIEGFTIQNDSAWGICLDTAATMVNTSVTFSNVTIASGCAMGVYAKPLTNCVLNMVDCVLSGGGSFNINVEGSTNTVNNQLNLTRCTIKDATVVNVQIGSPGYVVNMTDCVVSGNGMYGINTQGTGNTTNNRLNLTRCVVKGASTANMQMGCPGFEGTWINCIFAGDPQFNVLLQAAGRARFYNCTFGDTDTGDNTLVANDAGVTAGITNCIFYKGQHQLIQTAGAIRENYNLFYGQSGVTHSNLSAGANSIIGSDPAFTNAPAYDFHLTSGSPAIDQGTNLSAALTDDYDGNSRPAGGGYDMGAFEYPSGGTSVPMVDNDGGASNITASSATLKGNLISTGGAPTTVRIYWGTADGGTVAEAWARTNGFGIRGVGSFSTNVAGLAPDALCYYRCWASNSAGSAWSPTTTNFTTLSPHVTHYVSVSNANPVSPYTNWQTAAAVIQDAIDQTTDGDTVLVADGVYSNGGRAVTGSLTNRVAITNAITVQSVNGPGKTVIMGKGPCGDGAIRCAYVGTNAVLSGFALTNGSTRLSGDNATDKAAGGVWCESDGLVSNCIVVGNSASCYGGGSYGGRLHNCILIGNSALYGGGSSGSSLFNCALSGNSASYGGGSSGGKLCNCTLSWNSAYTGGGSHYGSLYNCILYHNTGFFGDNYYGASLSYSCTTPLPAGTGNITDDPQLVSVSRIASSSPCRAKGKWDYVTGSDLDGEGWLSPPSIGCDEHVTDVLTGALSVAISADYTNVSVWGDVAFAGYVEGKASHSEWMFGDGVVQSNTVSARHKWSATGLYTVVFQAFNDSYPDGVSATMNVNVGSVKEYYVNVSNLTPEYPHTSWETAATGIQEAVDVATPGGVIWVTNGVYETGGRAVYGAMTNRVALTKPVILKSVNGPGVTVIKGKGPFGDGAVRCAYVTNGAVLDGFTLTNGATRFTGDIYREYCGGGAWCESGAVVSNCFIVGNTAFLHGGGSAWGNLYSCALTGNTAMAGYGGGSFWGNLYNCTLSGNSAMNASGGGSAWASLYNCLLSGNRAPQGGGNFEGSLHNCTLSGNSATYAGGGTYHGSFYNCIFVMNSATYAGGGSYLGDLYNCVLTGNSAGDGGGSFADNLHNCIVYFNTASNENHNYSGGTISYSCTTPLATNGTGNIADEPQFVDTNASNYRLMLTSPCIDKGGNQDWMYSSTDMDGHQRIINGKVDIGAYEFRFEGNIKALLQGPYDAASNGMQTALAPKIPLTSPYAADAVSVSTVPSNVVDWALVQVRDGVSNAPIFARSMFLRNDGVIVDVEGNSNINIDVSPMTTNYVVVSHRNHLTVMSKPIAFTNQTIVCDFTTNSSCYYGGTNGCVQLEQGVWGMIAGDADGDGRITMVDRAICSNQVGQIGYKPADFDLDGVADDVSQFSVPNQDRITATPNGEVILNPHLTVSPGYKTILPADSVNLSAGVSTNPIQWLIIDNLSGGQLATINSNSALFTAGSASSCVDVIEAWDGDSQFGRAYMNVIAPADVSAAGKAVIVAGRASSDDALWPVTDYLAGKSFNVLTYCGFSKDNIQYLSPVTNRDVDGNGLSDDIDMETTTDNVANTFTNWINDSDRLFVYLVDHGGDSGGNGYLRLNSSQLLTASTLDSWLDAFQDAHQKDVIVLIDCCNAASLLDELSYTGTAKRVVMAATGADEPAYFIAGGLVSFSDAFFGGILRGQTFEASYLTAATSMSLYQNAEYYDNGGGHLAAAMYLGATFIAPKDIPQIGLVCGKQVLEAGTEAILWADDVVSAYGIDRVWCSIISPSHNPTNPAVPVSDIPEVELSYDNALGRYQGTYDGFSQEGTYKLIYYARDIWGGVSLPNESYVAQIGYDERVIIVAGGSTNSPKWECYNNIGNYIYQVLLDRSFDGSRIFYMNLVTNQDLNSDGSNDIDDLPIKASLEFAVTNWASTTNFGGPANKLTVYLVGDSTNDIFRLNDAESLAPADLDYLMDTYQASNSSANVIMDFDGSGSYIPSLRPPADRERICIASAMAQRESVMGADGIVSFSRFFMSKIYAGYSIGDAFEHAQTVVKRSSGAHWQNALLDDNGNGEPNEKDADNIIARERYIGMAFVTGNDIPVIGNTMPDAELTNSASLTIWISGLADMDGISNVWCEITPPDYGWSTNIIRVALTNNIALDRYEKLYAGFSNAGFYACAFYAEDNGGCVSAPRQAVVKRSSGSRQGVDEYEPDNSGMLATPFTVGETEIHTLHQATDEDWIYFYAVSNFLYDIVTTPYSNQIDIVIEICRGQTNGRLSLIGRVDEHGKDQGEVAALDHPQDGIYFARVFGDEFTGAGEYELSVALPPAEGTWDHVLVVGMDGRSHATLAGARVVVDGTREEPFNGKTFVDITGLANGVHTITLAGLPSGWGYYPSYPASQQVSIPTPPKGCVTFCVTPMFQANAEIQDQWTGERLGDVALSFVPTNSELVGEFQWVSQPDGALPGAPIAVTDWLVGMSKTGYSSTLFGIAGSRLSAGATTNLGMLSLIPVDANANGLADSWESLCFGAGTNVNPFADADNDGLNNREEYLVGTHPKDAASVFKVRNASCKETNGFTLNWSVTNGRTYRVVVSDNLISDLWSLTSGPWTASASMTNMTWTDTNAFFFHDRFYRIEVQTPSGM